MIRAGDNPQLIHEIWSRSSSDQELEGHFDWPNATTDQRAFINLLRPYKDSSCRQALYGLCTNNMSLRRKVSL